ncbi:FAD-dependent pyridine nucleotide-disulphide oxidoreductase [Xylanimonas cellulosilytica DSM 15894]|uniref:FAD-dependent pyridine nucleotide-disulphide oxidoreductase n=1 Tax=Xylanimonas cellulosilytica (strain DSM 15894 / JCM 12276 / CECT 5975 / KCTC 9989 / LMG 20990 / NBRC 107835 / XIL07) TaxID=446471 RepID=D1BXG8_XYLCX|nr:FAD-dependent pyridine nucleotide-disulphide oxidoreductase [Xylanimonas cellulosilytica DSM 15894]
MPVPPPLAPLPEPVPPRSVVVVGAGLAGTQTVDALREHGFDGRLTLLGAEGVPPYDRPPLSKELLTRPAPVWLSEDLGVDVEKLADDVRLADAATSLAVDAGSVTVTTASGARIEADAVVLATGSAPVRPSGWESAWTLHTAADAARLRATLRPGLRLVIVGAGWIGAELAGVAAGQGAEVTVVEAAPVPLERQLGAVVGERLAPWYDAAGVRLLTGVRVAGVDDGGVWLDGADRPDGGVSPGSAARLDGADQPGSAARLDGGVLPGSAARLDGAERLDGRGGRLDADVVLAAVGARPATGWLAGTLPLDATGRLRVDAAGRLTGHASPTDPAGRLAPAALSRVWAVGDVAVREHPVFGPVPGGHWSAALHDPEVTARAMLGLDPAPSDPEELRARLGLAPVARHAPYVFSRQLGHDLALLGLPTPADDVVLRGDPSAGPWAALYLERALDRHPRTTAEGHPVALLRAVLLVDSPRDVGPLRRLMNGPAPLHVDLTHALDPTRRLRDAAV